MEIILGKTPAISNGHQPPRAVDPYAICAGKDRFVRVCNYVWVTFIQVKKIIYQFLDQRVCLGMVTTYGSTARGGWCPLEIAGVFPKIISILALGVTPIFNIVRWQIVTTKLGKYSYIPYCTRNRVVITYFLNKGFPFPWFGGKQKVFRQQWRDGIIHAVRV